MYRASWLLSTARWCRLRARTRRPCSAWPSPARRSLHALCCGCRHLHFLVHLHAMQQQMLADRAVLVAFDQRLEMNLHVFLVLVELVHRQIKPSIRNWFSISASIDSLALMFSNTSGAIRAPNAFSISDRMNGTALSL